MDANELMFLNALNSIPGVGVATLRMLKNQCGSFANAWRADLHHLAIHHFQKPVERIVSRRPSLDPEKEFKKLEQQEIWIIMEDDPLFPPQLREIPNPPLLLYGRGQKPDTSTIMIGMVGTRHPTIYGKQVTQQIGEQLAGAGLVIVSGLAVGIDTVAHHAALNNNKPTIAVVGSGLGNRVLFPSENRQLAEQIAHSGGTILSEYAPDTQAAREYFPMRNRIISGLSRGVLVVEARERSGALITAQCALEQNRDVFAIPGSIFSPTSAGAHSLIQQGAKLVLHAKDICSEWGIEITDVPNAESDAKLDKNEKTMLKLLEQEMTVDELREQANIETPVLMSTLSLLELKGYIRQMGNNKYQRI